MQWERNRHRGKQGEEIVRDMLEDSGYRVISYGFESLSNLAFRLKGKKRTDCGEVERQIRSTPDFLIYDPPKEVGGGFIRQEDLMIIEVKTRKLLNPRNSNFLLYDFQKKDRIEDYLKYWENSFLVLVIPDYDFFYISKMKKINPNKFVYSARNDFQKIQKVFSRISDKTINKYQLYVKEIF